MSCTYLFFHRVLWKSFSWLFTNQDPKMCLQIKIAVWVNYCQIKFMKWFYASVEFTVTVSNTELQINNKKIPLFHCINIKIICKLLGTFSPFLHPVKVNLWSPLILHSSQIIPPPIRNHRADVQKRKTTGAQHFPCFIQKQRQIKWWSKTLHQQMLITRWHMGGEMLCFSKNL